MPLAFCLVREENGVLEKVSTFAQVKQHLSKCPPSTEHLFFTGFFQRGCFLGSKLTLRSLFSWGVWVPGHPQDPRVRCIMSLGAVRGTHWGGGGRGMESSFSNHLKSLQF